MYGISIYGIFVYNPFLFFFFLRFLNSIFYDDLIPSDPRGISSSSSTCSSSASASCCLQTQWIKICSNHNQDFFFITVDSLFNMKYLPLIHCFELNRENIKLRAPNFCYDIIQFTTVKTNLSKISRGASTQLLIFHTFNHESRVRTLRKYQVTFTIVISQGYTHIYSM